MIISLIPVLPLPIRVKNHSLRFSFGKYLYSLGLISLFHLLALPSPLQDFPITHFPCHIHIPNQHLTSPPPPQSSTPLSIPSSTTTSPPSLILVFISSTCGTYASLIGNSTTTFAFLAFFKNEMIVFTSHAGCSGEYSGSAARMMSYLSSLGVEQTADQSRALTLVLPPLGVITAGVLANTLALRFGTMAGRSVR